MQYLHHNWRNEGDLGDLRQEVYLRLYEAAPQVSRPDPVRPFLFLRSRAICLSIACAGHKSFRLTLLRTWRRWTSPPLPRDRTGLSSRGMNCVRFNSAIDRLPTRCREAVVLARIEGLSGRQIAIRMNVTESAVSHYLDRGLRALVEMLYGEPPDPRKRQ